MFISHRNRGLELEGHIIHPVPDTASIKTAYDAFCGYSLGFAQEGGVWSKSSLGTALEQQQSQALVELS